MMKMGKRLVLLCALATMVFLFRTDGYAILNFEYEFHGAIQNTSVLRDLNGFQYGVFDDNDWVAVRNQLKFDISMRPRYDIQPSFRLEKIFLCYRGAYDAIYDLVDDYDNLPSSRSNDGSRYDLGKDDVMLENDLREAFVDLALEAGGSLSNLRVGRQIVQWGEAGLFNVVNVVNPQDLSAMRAFDNPDDLANPIWMSRFDFTTPPMGFINEASLQFLYIPDNRPTIFGASTRTVGSPYSIFIPGVDVRQNDHTTDMGNAQYGVRMGASIGRMKNYLYFFDGFTAGPVLNFTHMFDTGTLFLDHPRYKMYGASFNYDARGGFVLRGEGAFMDKEYLTDWAAGPKAYTGVRSYQALIGLDRSFFSTHGFPGAGGTPLTTSFEAWYRHTNDWDFDKALRSGRRENQYRLTFVANTMFNHGTILPVFACAYDFAGVFLTSLSIDYTPDGRWFAKLMVSSTYGDVKATDCDFQPLINSSEVGFRFGWRW